MKKTLYILLALIAVAICLIYFVNRNDNTVTPDDINKVRQEFRSQFGKVLNELDSVKAELKAANKKIDELKADTDTLKQGEAIIFNEVKKANDKTIWDFFK